MSKKETQNDSFVPKEEMLEKIRAAIKDRATWFALLFEEFSKVLPEKTVEEVSRRAIYRFGLLKAKKDPEPFHPKDWVIKHKEKGSADVFQSEVSYTEEWAEQRMTHCPLVDAWKELGLSDEKVQLLCDIAMEGDRGRAEGHPGITMDLHETIGKGCSFCRLVIRYS